MRIRKGGGSAAASSGSFCHARQVQPKPGVERYTYHLTDKGHDLLPTLVALMQWGNK